MKTAIYLVLATSIAINGILVWTSLNPATPAMADVKGGEELSVYMDHLQRQAHKLGLAISAKNQPLAAFYMQEINESVVVIQTKFPEYDDFQIGALSKAMLEPFLTPLGKAVDGSDWKGAGAAYQNLFTSGCNGCHTATQHGFIKVVPSDKHSYNQDFTP